MERQSVPTRTETRRMLTALADGTKPREEVADWALQWVRLPDPEVQDRAVWRALVALSGADLPTTDRDYLHGEVDFRDWLRRFDDEISN
jgi:hypothetical protein